LKVVSLSNHEYSIQVTRYFVQSENGFTPWWSQIGEQQGLQPAHPHHSVVD
jgi:hypothetical protein